MAGERLSITPPLHAGKNSGYEPAIRRGVPEPFFKRAAEFVQSRKPTDPRLKDLDVQAMAKVLVVEDEKNWMRHQTNIAKESGHEVVTAASAEEAIKTIKEDGVEFIVTDGLENKWTTVHDIAQDKGIRTVVVSSSGDVKTEAQKRGVPFVDKLDIDNLYDNLSDIYTNIDNRD